MSRIPEGYSATGVLHVAEPPLKEDGKPLYDQASQYKMMSFRLDRYTMNQVITRNRLYEPNWASRQEQQTVRDFYSRVKFTPISKAEIQVSFRHNDPARAQAVAADLLNAMVANSRDYPSLPEGAVTVSRAAAYPGWSDRWRGVPSTLGLCLLMGVLGGTILTVVHFGWLRVPLLNVGAGLGLLVWLGLTLARPDTYQATASLIAKSAPWEAPLAKADPAEVDRVVLRALTDASLDRLAHSQHLSSRANLQQNIRWMFDPAKKQLSLTITSPNAKLASRYANSLAAIVSADSWTGPGVKLDLGTIPEGDGISTRWAGAATSFGEALAIGTALGALATHFRRSGRASTRRTPKGAHA